MVGGLVHAIEEFRKMSPLRWSSWA